MNTKEIKLSNNIFYDKMGRFWIRKKSPLIFLDFKSIFLSTPHFCNDENKLDLSRLELHYKKYLEIFKSEVKFPKYKKSRINLVLGLCKMNSKLDFYLDRGFIKDEAILILNKRQDNTSLSSFISVHGEKIGKVKFEEYSSKWKKSISKYDKKDLYKNWKNTPEKYLNKVNPNTGNLFTKEESENKIKNDLSKGFKKVWKEYKDGERDNSFINTTVDYYLSRGMKSEEAKDALKERQSTFSLEKCIQKYGFDDGVKKFNQRNEKWIKTLDGKSPEEKKRILLSKTRNFPRYSKESLDFFETLISKIDIDPCDILMGENEMVLWNPEIKKPYFYDFSIPSLKIIIEYNGSAFHPNLDKITPDEIEKWICPFSKQNAMEKYNYDNTKNNFARSLGYDLMIVWDNDEYNSKLEKSIKLIENKIKR